VDRADKNNTKGLKLTSNNNAIFGFAFWARVLTPDIYMEVTDFEQLETANLGLFQA
jgi:hypothetical protein